MTQLKLQFLGTPEIRLDGELVDLNRRKALALLAYLSVSGKIHSRETLATLFWPDYEEQRSFAYLRQAIWTLKKALGGGWFEVEREWVSLNPGAEIWVDVHKFRNLLADCRTHGHHGVEVCPACIGPLVDAAATYRGDFLTGFTLPDSPEFDQWQYFQSEKLRRDLTNAVERLVHYLSVQGDLASALIYAQRWLALDPLHELAHRNLMSLYAQTHQRSAALLQYEQCAQILKRDLGVNPLDETTELYTAIKENRPLPAVAIPIHLEPAAPESEWGTKPLLAHRIEQKGVLEGSEQVPRLPFHNFPAQPTPFVGREEELSSVSQLLNNPECRLLTLYGPGGIGKTRLAIQAVSAANGRYPNGVFFVPLAAVSSASFLVPTIATILNLPFYGQEDPKVLLFNYLREKQMLLLLDNFEHLTDGGALLSEILSEASGLKLLVTSRARLNLRGEWAFEVKGLEIPAEDSSERVEDFSAFQLFVQSAKRIWPEFRLGEADKEHIVQICQLVEGAPLAIELAAAWIRMLTPKEIKKEITLGLDFLTASLKDFPKRHQSLGAVFEHSWDLMTAEEQNAFRQLAVFCGGFSRTAAQFVAGARQDLLLALMDKSLVRRAPSGRYELHEILRQYAEGKLKASSGEHRSALGRHSKYYARFLDERVDHLRRGRQVETIREIREEIENVRRGWRSAVERRSAGDLARSIEGLYLFYDSQGWIREGYELFGDTAEELSTHWAAENGQKSTVNKLLATLYARKGDFAIDLGQYEEARSLLQSSLQTFRSLGSQAGIAFCLSHLGNLSRLEGEYDDAKQLLEKSISLCTETGERRMLARALNMLGIVMASKGEYAEANQLFRASLARLREIGDLWGIAKALNNMGIVTYYLEQHPEADRMYQESLRINTEIGDRYGVAISLNNLGLVQHALGAYERASRLHEESLATMLEIGYLLGAGLCRNDLGKAAMAIRDHAEADRHFTDALATGVQIRAMPLAMSALVGIAELRMEEQAFAEALQLLILALKDPASDQETKDAAERLLSKLEYQLSPKATKAAWERAGELRFQHVVDEILGEKLLRPPSGL